MQSLSSLVHTRDTHLVCQFREIERRVLGTPHPAGKAGWHLPHRGTFFITSLFSKELQKARFKFTLGDVGLSTQSFKSCLRDVFQPDKQSSKES